MPDDNTDLNASTERHGLLPKLAGNTSLYLRSDGTWQYVAGGGGDGDMLKATYDTDEDGLIDAAAGGTEWDTSAVTGVAYITAGTWSSKTLGIADTNILVVSGMVNNGEHCRFTAIGIEGLTNSELLADLSGDAGSSFDWNGQDLTNVGNVDGRDVSADGTKLDGIEAGADVTDATNVAAAGALMDGDTDNVDDTHINWGSGAGQVDADDILESATKKWAGETGADVTDATNVNAAGAVMESDFDATTFLYATLDNTPEAKTPAQVLAILSGNAGGAFDWNGQDLTNIGNVDGRDVSADGTKLDGIEAGADVTDATNVNAAGAVMESDFDADTFMYATLDDTPAATSPADVLAALSGHAGATFDWNSQYLTNIGNVGIADDNLVEIDDADAADNDYAKFTANGLEGRDYNEVRSDLSVPDITTATVTLYVDGAAGDDGNPGTSVSPKETIQGALDALPTVIAHVCTILVRGVQSYSESNSCIEFSRFNTLSYIELRAVNSNDENLYDNGQATGGSSTTLQDTSQSWSTNQFDGAYIWIYNGNGQGDHFEIASNTADTITITGGTFSATPDSSTYYAIGGGVTLSGSDTNHFYVEGKAVRFYGFDHTNASTGDIRCTRFSNVQVMNNRHTDAGYAVRIEQTAFGYSYYNYVDSSTDYGIDISMGSQVFVRACVFISCNEGLRSFRISAISGSSAEASVCYFYDCDYDVTEGSGGVAASSQDYGGTASLQVDASSWNT